MLLFAVRAVPLSSSLPGTLQLMGWSTLSSTSFAFLRIAGQGGQLSTQHSKVKYPDLMFISMSATSHPSFLGKPRTP